MSDVFNIKHKGFSLYVDVDKHSIESITIYGSQVRGNSEKNSDLDLLIIIDDCPPYLEKKTRRKIASELDVPLGWVTLYTKTQFRNACKSGDYFLWGIYLAKKTVFSRSKFTSKSFNSLEIFDDVSGNLYHDRDFVEKRFHDFCNGDVSAMRAIAAITMKLRNCCILLCYMHHILEFDKYHAIELCYDFSDVYLPFTLREYKFLYHIKQSKKYPKSLNRKKLYDFVDEWYENYMSLSDEALKISRRVMNRYFRSPLLDL